MAKVRVQTRGTEDNDLDQAEQGFSHRKPKYSGALDVLRKVWLTEGFLGWYQVSNAPSGTHECSISQYLGHGRANRQSRALASFVIHVEGPIRTLRTCHLDIIQADHLIARRSALLS